MLALGNPRTLLEGVEGSQDPRLPDSRRTGDRPGAGGRALGAAVMSRRANPTAIGAFVVGASRARGGGHHHARRDADLQERAALRHVLRWQHRRPRRRRPGRDPGCEDRHRHEDPYLRRSQNIGKIGVYVNIDPALLPKDAAVRRSVDAVESLIKQGLRAQLKTQSLLTGLLLVYLDFFPGTPITLVRLDPDVKEIPTIPTTLEQLQARVEKFIDKLGTINIDELVKDVSLTLKGAKDLMSDWYDTIKLNYGYNFVDRTGYYEPRPRTWDVIDQILALLAGERSGWVSVRFRQLRTG